MLESCVLPRAGGEYAAKLAEERAAYPTKSKTFKKTPAQWTKRVRLDSGLLLCAKSLGRVYPADNLLEYGVARFGDEDVEMVKCSWLSTLCIFS